MNEVNIAAAKLEPKEEERYLNSAENENKMIARNDSLARGYSGTHGIKGLSDEQLIGSFVRDNDEQAFNEIVNRYANKIFRLALRITCKPREAEEVLQEVFLTVEKSDTFRGESKFLIWLYRVAISASYAHLRVKKEQYKNEVDLEDYPYYIESGALDRLKANDWINIPEGVLLSPEGIETIKRIVNELPELYRLVFHLRDGEGLTNHDAAKVLELSLPAVKYRILRARHLLRERLSDYLNGSRM